MIIIENHILVLSLAHENNLFTNEQSLYTYNKSLFGMGK